MDSKKLHNNYFKVTAQGYYDKFFFFNGGDTDDTIDAWRKAVKTAGIHLGLVSMWKPPRIRGQWDQVASVVGHRHRDEILADMAFSVDQENARENAALAEEMDSLSDRWRTSLRLAPAEEEE